ncbi:protein SLOW GREEN 1, chloroplastic-like [Vicia villosa]|uniref:protein SLOW GREEN 1, chloroplastic-like n=1 Tax=Vicia villosa TaxID=3911 RepID=UPI00273AB136|nr:protein SLOW GREEN 1, chloroplastic-like [Vicia villosa]XP_058764599.1 protein SLOW GREEN 1, chloroplastic-like [Vicia villosa]XP_058783655.1 protein SLOW GREEN 1, chloroplastic-like [Vicia villosa]
MTPLPKTLHYHHPSFNHRHSPFPLPSSTFSIRPLPPRHFSSPPFLSSSSSSSSSIKASSSSSSSSPSPKPQNPFSQLLKLLNPFYSPLFEPAYVAVALLAFFLFRFQQNPATVTSPLPPPPAQSSTTTAASPLPPPPEESSTATTTTTTDENSSENNYLIDDILIETCSDVNALRSLAEEKVKAKKLSEAIRAVDRIIELEPEEFDLHLLKAHLHCYNGEHELAKNGFELTLNRDPFNSEAYRGLLMANMELKEPLEGFLNRVDEVVKFFEEKKMEAEARDFKLLIAQVKVMQEDYSGALKVYEEIVKEEPSDFRPYLCQGVVYTLLRKNDEAAKQFEEYRKLVPENHPYKKLFEDNTQILSKKIEKGGIEAKI